jgi:hypothetical protein
MQTSADASSKHLIRLSEIDGGASLRLFRELLLTDSSPPHSAMGLCSRLPAVAQAFLGQTLDDALLAGAEGAFLLLGVKLAARILGLGRGRVLRPAARG